MLLMLMSEIVTIMSVIWKWWCLELPSSLYHICKWIGKHSELENQSSGESLPHDLFSADQVVHSYLMPWMCMLSHFSCVQLFATPRTVAHWAPLSIGFSRQEYWSGVPCPPPGGLPNPGSNPGLLRLPHCRWVLYHWCHLGNSALNI